MSEFSSLTHKFRANLDNPGAGASKVSKRNRQPLSCAPCRTKKLKCDRGHPCETCMKRGDPTSCYYGKNASASTKPESHGTNSKGKAQERLRHLEHLILQMVDQNGQNGSHSQQTSADSATDSLGNPVDSEPAEPGATGHLQFGSTEARYVGSTHWSAILDNIQEIKVALGTDNASSTDLEDSEDPETTQVISLFASAGNLTLAQILAQALPTRLQVDRRLSTYFKSQYLVMQFIHTGQFQRQYEEFWRHPLETPPLWVSILFSICCMSATLSQAVGSEQPTPEDRLSPRMSFLHASCACLKLGGYVRPKKWIFEALGLYAQCQYMATMDPSKEVGMVFSMLVRLAYRSGYHRDPSHFRHISVFDGEMRRRCWAMCRQFDLMVAFQLGLPSLIPPDSWDTRSPRNLLDSDFDEDTTVLPPSRPETEPTQILYFIVKSRLMTAFGRICAHALSFRDCSRQEIMDLDAEVRSVHATVPEILRIKPLSQSFADPNYLIMVRLNCEFLYQKCLLVLHRKYMTQGGHPESSEAAIAAATTITTYMLDMYKEFKPGGQLHTDRWMLSSFVMNDFYLAAMMLCLSVSMWKKTNPGETVSDDEQIKARVDLLANAYVVCEESSANSIEAKRITGVLSTILGEYVYSPSRRNNGTHSPPSSSPAPVTSSEAIIERREMFRLQPSAFFPNPFSFNLAPLTLSDTPAPEPPGNSGGRDSSFREGAPNSAANRHATVSYFDSLAHMANENPGHDQVDSIMPSNLFAPFLPFNPNYGFSPSLTTSDAVTSTASEGFPASAPAMQTQNALPGDVSSEGMNMNMNTNIDIDWAFLDQWMAVPAAGPDADAETLMQPVPVPLATTDTHPFLDNAASNNNNIDAGAGAGNMAPASASSNGDWTSTPIRFLGTNFLQVNEHGRHGSSQAQRTASTDETSMDVSMGHANADAMTPASSSGASHSMSTDQYPLY
ncbi:uncharacterized protein A1O9_11821 [Exophiala aquamarina CBS 119918]|uniref:Zn(2)-C6 fungal-type domain-containing protein n=1 Tax=Exophiala aquamarina CBS 119918 TaxID=1182545 RepID=A0A072NWE0_9EURO|nr:uncharacterized protein A1O9_11821 [Exophiala aquamarina CBS 119918]KEF52194.1 hypothetical protein A1O9_11821 [Exophiala aquamarina CBS 119918]